MPRAKKTNAGSFRSGFEKAVSEKLKEIGVKIKYEYITVPYVLEKHYTPDFTINKRVHLECKGRFRPGDQAKMLAVAKANPDLEIIFVFMKPELPIRKGAKMTHADWADKHGFKWTTLEELCPSTYTQQTKMDLKN